MTNPIEHVAIVGGGTAGWLTACILASEFQDSAGHPSVKVVLVESPDIPTLGVGEREHGHQCELRFRPLDCQRLSF